MNRRRLLRRAELAGQLLVPDHYPAWRTIVRDGRYAPAGILGPIWVLSAGARSVLLRQARDTVWRVTGMETPNTIFGTFR